jgi:Tfp pilus assembly protein PilE
MKKNMANKKARKARKTRGGFTLLEAVIALALWLLLSVSVFFVWQHSARSGEILFARQNAFENARISMDALIMNLQMSERIRVVNNGGVLRRLDLYQRGRTYPYQFHFERVAAQLNFGFVQDSDNNSHDFSRGNEFASNIAKIKIEYDCENKIMHIEITTGCVKPKCCNGRTNCTTSCVLPPCCVDKINCGEPIILHGSVDLRYKYVQ